MNIKYFNQNPRNQFVISIISTILVSAVCYSLSNVIGYRTVALILMATVSIQAIFFSLYPVLMAATLSALIWDFFFIPPHFTFHVGSSEDVLMLLMYFVIALINGVLTSKVRALEKLELQKEERHNTIKLYKTLFDSISHELRTPIATIVGASDNLLQKDSNVSDDDKSKLLDEISIAAFRLNRLIDNLLSMQRLESGMLRIKPDWCEINELVNMPLNRLKNELSTHDVKIELQEDFPVFKLDFGLIEQALFNILHNEVLYTPADSRIVVVAKLVENKLSIEISDDGEGFSEEELKHLFTKFYRATAKTAGGTGLGLSIVKGFVEAHGGQVKAENNVPHGAKFMLLIPVETLELQDYMDFTDLMVKKDVHHESLTDTYIPKKKHN
ncbi:MAG TPA: ATP-binding protein [Paludibacter sp.]|nr:ATP-binding protein [Paludibacter sp.]